MNTQPTALITGAARGIGRAAALELAADGWNVAALDLVMSGDEDRPGLLDLEQPVTDRGGGFLPIEADVADTARHSGVVTSVVETFGRIDLLLNNAGVAPLERCDILELTEESWERVLGINLRGAFFLTREVARAMLGSAPGVDDYEPKIIFITSISAGVSSVNRAEYCISKAALSMAATLYADRLAAAGIPVYEIRPGIIRTGMTAPVIEKYEELAAGGGVPLGRLGEPEDVARVVGSLARGAFAYATGTVIEVSGGMNIRRL